MKLLSIILGMLGIAVAIIGWNSVLIRSIGMIMLLASTLIKSSRAWNRNKLNTIQKEFSNANKNRNIPRPVWIFGGLSLVASAAFFVLLLIDSHDADQNMLLYALILSSTILIVDFSYIIFFMLLKGKQGSV